MIEKWRYWKAEEEKSKWHLILDSPKTIRSAVDLGAMFCDLGFSVRAYCGQ